MLRKSRHSQKNGFLIKKRIFALSYHQVSLLTKYKKYIVIPYGPPRHYI